MIPASWRQPYWLLLSGLIASNTLLLAYILHVSLALEARKQSTQSAQLGHLTVATLAYNASRDTPKLEHNCRIIHNTRHKFLIYTSNMSASYCALCTCRRFVPVNCPNPHPRKKKNLCEKLAFVARMVQELGELVYLDSDLIIMKPSFLDHLYWRSRANDFLASYFHKGYGHSFKYHRQMNSGLFFLRRIDNANYSDLLPMMYRMKESNDQHILTQFVFRSYSNWDSLSWKWHCRSMIKTKQDIPVGDCLTLHDRWEEERLRAQIGHTLLTIPF